MQLKYHKPEWLEIIAAQEEKLRVPALSSKDIFKLGGIAVRLAEDVYGKPVSIRVIWEGQTTLSFLMDGTDTFNEWWMDKKLNVCNISGISSLRTMVEIGTKVRPMVPAFENEHNYALCGGSFPLRDAQGVLHGWFEISGMQHWKDHQLAADTLAEFLKVEIPRIDDDRISEDF